MALKGPRAARKIPGTTLFLLRASPRLLCPGDAAPDKRLCSCFEQLYLGGIPAAGAGLWGRTRAGGAEQL